MARNLIDSEQSAYRLWGDPIEGIDEEEVRQAAKNLLEKDGYHFGKTTAVSTRVAD